MYIIKPVAFGDEDSRGNFQNGLNNAGIMSGKIISQVERNVNLACYIPFGQVISAVRKDTDVQIGVDGLDMHCGSQNQIIREILPDADIQGAGIILPEGFHFFEQTKLGIHELGLLLIEDLPAGVREMPVLLRENSSVPSSSSSAVMRRLRVG